MYTNKEKILPFFPLGVFLLPGEDIPLRIFEPRYLQLIEEARQDGFTFAIPFTHKNEMSDLGCEVKLQQVVAESEQGKKVITVESVSLLRINSYISHLEGKLYDGGLVSAFPSPGIITNPGLINTVINYSEYYDRHFASDFKERDLSYFDVIRALNLSSEEKFTFVSLDNNTQRDRFLLKQLNYYMLIHQQEKKLNNDFRLN
jgi:hypothetical protein